MYHNQTVAAIRHYLSRELASRLCTPHVISRPDYCSSVLSGVAKCSLRTLQLSLNIAVRHVFKAKWSCHISLLLDQLKCLQTEKHIEENFLTLVFKARNGQCRSYLNDPLHAYVPSRTLLSSDPCALTIRNF